MITALPHALAGRQDVSVAPFRPFQPATEKFFASCPEDSSQHGGVGAASTAGAMLFVAKGLRKKQARRPARTARASVVSAAVAAAASAAKVAAAGASAVGLAIGVKDRVEKPTEHKSGKRPKVVVLGTGWGAATFLQGLSEKEACMYDITVVSPRNFFLYTPLLPACTMGSVEERSIMTPFRSVVKGKAEYLEAKCEEIDTVKKVVRCCRAGAPKKPSDVAYERFPEGDVDGKLTFILDYDILIYAVGAQTNDFNTPGVKDNAFFFKEVPDARKVREKVADLFERASLPTTTPEQRDAWLSFVVIGGGPTGVEVAADLADFISGEATQLYPKLVPHVKVRLINTGQYLLSTYDRGISQASKDIFREKGVEVMTGYRVTEMTPEELKMVDVNTKEEVALKYGAAVWAAGIKEHALTSQLKSSLIEKNYGVSELNVTSLKAPARGIITDEWLQVRGSGGSIFALGDAATVRNDRTLPFAEQLFKAADVDNSGDLTYQEMLDVFTGASDEFPQLEEYAMYLSTVVETDESRWANVAKVFSEGIRRERQAFKKVKELAFQSVGDRTAKKGFDSVAADLAETDADSNVRFDFEEFKELLDRIDRNLQAFPPTAQVAAQQGKFLAKLFSKGVVDGELTSFEEAAKSSGPFTYFHKGSLAYLGGGSAAFDLPVIGPVTGPAAGVAWKLYETSAQLSWKNRALVGLDWLREGLWGRDTSRA
eukprot:TRINITY_DN49754_c0_g1_i1.p1 TRINITY_DN49754_c0_g1~~TRINITY_DN49754_c0_g1_i1.p1  ORF type:complete len:729 (+),score=164.41 TRINITY_DN49754_c0_g1_i1:49-2187(+)